MLKLHMIAFAKCGISLDAPGTHLMISLLLTNTLAPVSWQEAGRASKIVMPNCATLEAQLSIAASLLTKKVSAAWSWPWYCPV